MPANQQNGRVRLHGFGAQWASGLAKTNSGADRGQAAIQAPPATPISRGCAINGAAVEPGVYRIGSVTVHRGESRADSPAESGGEFADFADHERGAIAATASDAARLPATVLQEDPSRFCPVCSQRLESRRCKLVCNVCGYYMSCADYY